MKICSNYSVRPSCSKTAVTISEQEKLKDSNPRSKTGINKIKSSSGKPKAKSGKAVKAIQSTKTEKINTSSSKRTYRKDIDEDGEPFWF